MSLRLTGLSDEALAVWVCLLNTEIDLASAGEAGPIPLSWLEERCAEAYAERDRRNWGWHVGRDVAD